MATLEGFEHKRNACLINVPTARSFVGRRLAKSRTATYEATFLERKQVYGADLFK